MRKLTLVLDLNSGQFSTRITDASGQLRIFNSVAGQTDKTVKSAKHSTNEFADSLHGLHSNIRLVHVAMAALTGSVGGLALQLVKVNAETQRSIAMLKGLSKSATETAKQLDAATDFKFLRNFSENAPYSLHALTDVFIKLKSAGIDPAAGSMKALVDGVAAFGGDNEVLKRAAIAIQQMAGKGVISMEELRQQLGEAMPTALRLMAQAAGKTVPEFVKAVSQGQVAANEMIGTFGKFWPVLENANKDAAKRLMDTLDGQVSVIKTRMRSIALAIGGFQDDGTFSRGGLMAALTKDAKGVADWLADPETARSAKEFGKMLAGLVTDLRNFVAWVSENQKAIQVLAAAFAAFKAAELAAKGLNQFAKTLGIVDEKTKQVTASALKKRLGVIAGYDQEAVAAAKSATAQSAASAQTVADIQARIVALKAEQAQYQAAALAARNAQLIGTGSLVAGEAATVAGMGGMVASRQAGDVAAYRAELAIKKELATVTAALTAEQAALAAAEVAAAEAAVVEAAALSRVSLAGRAMAATSGVLGGVVTLLGGPVMASLIAVAGAILLVGNSIRDSEAIWAAHDDTVRNATDVIKSAEEAMTGLKDKTKDANTKTGDFAAQLGENTTKVRDFAGAVGDLAQRMWDLARASRAAQVSNLLRQRADNATQLKSEEGNQNNTWTNAAEDLRDFFTLHWGAGVERYKDRRAKIIDLKNKGDQLDEELKKVLSAPDEAFATQSVKDKAVADLKQDDPAIKNKHKITDDERGEKRAERELKNLNAKIAGVKELNATLNVGAEAAAEMRSKIEEGLYGNTVKSGLDKSGSVASKLIKAANDYALASEKIGKATKLRKDMMEQAVEEDAAGKEAMENYAATVKGVDQGVDKLARTLAKKRAELIELGPAYQEGSAALAEFDKSAKKALDGRRARDLADELINIRAETRQMNIDNETALMTEDQKRQFVHDREIERLKERIALSKLEGQARIDAEKELAEAIKALDKKLEIERESPAQKMVRQYQDAQARLKDLQGEWLQGFYQTMRDGSKGWKDFLVKMLEDWAWMLIQAKTASAVNGALDALSNLATTALNAYLGGGATLPTQQTAVLGSKYADIDTSSIVKGTPFYPGYHSGGIVGAGAPTFRRQVHESMFYGAAKYHSGGVVPGLHPGEVPTILKKGEGVFTPEQMAAMGGRATPNVSINLINESGQQLDADQGSVKFDGEGWVLDVVVSNLGKRGPLREAVRGLK